MWSYSNYVKNPNLLEMPLDELFHLGLSTQDNLKATFGNVKVALIFL